ncbi:MAG: metalloregulator ArsR/SmtB family transcription factor [Bryobacteraceae bacterium]
MDPLDALGNAVRRAILRELRKGPLSVSDIAERFPVSRPAVSRHLGSLRDAGLVQVRHRRRQSFYSIRPQGFIPVRKFIDDLWDTALARLEDLAKNG